MKELLTYTFVEGDLTTAILVVRNKTSSLVYTALGSSKPTLLKEAEKEFTALSKKANHTDYKFQADNSFEDPNFLDILSKNFRSLIDENVEHSDIKYEYMFGTPFQRKVWDEIGKIEMGKTITYGEIAENIGKPKSSRAVGAACGKNKLSLLIPCHRVLGSSRSITGYRWSIPLKKKLLTKEKILYVS